ncbi:nuclear transport factor 2 family protein [Amycolatopsis sp. NPDC051371]|uniref:nuclear transport factor 2 family protein n=1 Tax=Amycolatopsis sp. NPDC051371 TaxID=3155800 RepID=UPI0034305A51
MENDELIDLEQQGWQALMATLAAARKFYDGVFDERIVVLLSDLPPIRTRGEALDALCGSAWEEFRLHGLRCVELSEGTGVVRYSIAATRSALPYSAQVSSVYARRPGGWKLTFHQRTRR